MKTVQRKEVIKFYQIINHDEPVAVMSFRPPLIGVFTNQDALDSALKKKELNTVYTTTNTVKRESLKKLPRNKFATMTSNNSISANDIKEFRYFFVDIDVVGLRENDDRKRNATDEEHAEAEEVAKHVRKFLDEKGFPNPIFIDSGNGFHLLYPIHLSATKQNETLIKNALIAISEEVNTASVKIDTVVADRSRKLKMPGSTNNGDEAYYRMSEILEYPEEQIVVTEEHLTELAKLRKSKGNGWKSSKSEKAKLLQDATERKFDLVLTWKINRLSRNLQDSLEIINTLEKYNITYKSYSEPFETDTPAGKMQFQIMSLVAEFERNTISQNVKMGMCAKAKAGEWCGGIAPLGYKWVQIESTQHSSRKKSRLEIDEKEAQTVRLIFELYASGKGYKAIANQLNKAGYKTKRGNYFSVAPLRDILMNPVYIGKVRFNVRRDWNEKRRSNKNPNPIIADGIHKAIIEQELWDKVQFMLEQRKGKPSRIYDGEYPLTGILKCPECGAGMVLSRTTNTLKDGTKKKITYYACGAWKNKGTAVCHSNSIRVEKANNTVYRELEKLFSNEKILESVLKRVNAENVKRIESAKKRVKICESDIEECEKKKNKIFEAYEKGIFTDKEFIERKKVITDEIQVLLMQKNEAQVILEKEQMKEIPHEAVKDALQNFGKILSSDRLDRELKKQLLHMVISEITLDKRREIDSIKIHLTDEMMQFFNFNVGETPTKGVSPNLFKDYKINTFDLEMVI